MKTTPKDVVIKLNNRTYPDQSGILQSETIIQNLLPKSYALEISKNGYFPYYKNITVKKALVSKLSKVVLIPEKIKIDKIISTKGNEIIEVFGNRKIISDNLNNYYLYDSNDLLSAFNINAAFYRNAATSTKIKDLAFLPTKNSDIIIEDYAGLKTLDIKTGKSILLAKNPVAWNIENSSLYFIKNQATQNGKTKNPAIYSINLLMLPISSASLVSEIKNTSSTQFVKIKSSGGKIALFDTNNNLYLFDQNQKTTLKIAGNAKFFSFSPDGKKLAFLDKNGKINVYFLEESNIDIMKNAGDITQLELPDKENIQLIKWHKDSAHLFISFKKTSTDKKIQELKFMEIDDRPELNVYPIAQNISDFEYDSESNIMYLTVDNQLNKIDFNNL